MYSLDAGIYNANLVSASTGESGEKKTPHIAIEFSVTHVARNGQWQDLPSPEKRTVYVYLSDASWPYSKPKLEALGFNGDFAEPAFEKREGIDLECRIEKYEGKEREKWEFPYAKGEEAPLADDRARALAARWKAEHANAPKRSAAQAAPPAPAPTPESKSPEPTSAPSVGGDSQVAARNAWKAFKANFKEGTNKAVIEDNWKRELAKQFPGREPKNLTDAEWTIFTANVDTDELIPF